MWRVQEESKNCLYYYRFWRLRFSFLNIFVWKAFCSQGLETCLNKKGYDLEYPAYDDSSGSSDRLLFFYILGFENLGERSVFESKKCLFSFGITRKLRWLSEPRCNIVTCPSSQTGFKRFHSEHSRFHLYGRGGIFCWNLLLDYLDGSFVQLCTSSGLPTVSWYYS